MDVEEDEVNLFFVSFGVLSQLGFGRVRHSQSSDADFDPPTQLGSRCDERRDTAAVTAGVDGSNDAYGLAFGALCAQLEHSLAVAMRVGSPVRRSIATRGAFCSFVSVDRERKQQRLRTLRSRSEEQASLAHAFVAPSRYSSPFAILSPPIPPHPSKPLQQFIPVMPTSGIGSSQE